MTIVLFILLGVFIGIMACGVFASYGESCRMKRIIRMLEQGIEMQRKAEEPTKEYSHEENTGNTNG